MLCMRMYVCAHHGLQPSTQSWGQASQQLHGRLTLTLAVQQSVAEPLATQNQELGAQHFLIFHLQHGLGETWRNIRQRVQHCNTKMPREKKYLLSPEVQALAEELADQLPPQDVGVDLQQRAQLQAE